MTADPMGHEPPCDWQPCPEFVTLEDGRRIYCEQGADGHWGTHCGDRDENEYMRLKSLADDETGHES